MSVKGKVSEVRMSTPQIEADTFVVREGVVPLLARHAKEELKEKQMIIFDEERDHVRGGGQ